MTIVRYVVTVEMPNDASGRDVLIPNHGRIREEIEQFVESEYPDAAVEVQWLSLVEKSTKEES